MITALQCQPHSQEFFAAIALRKQLLHQPINFYREAKYQTFALIEEQKVIAAVTLQLYAGNFVHIRQVVFLPEYQNAANERLLKNFIYSYFQNHPGSISVKTLAKIN
ncbi:hypothetical protein [Enterococcus sp. LJL90]